MQNFYFTNKTVNSGSGKTSYQSRLLEHPIAPIVMNIVKKKQSILRDFCKCDII